MTSPSARLRAFLSVPSLTVCAALVIAACVSPGDTEALVIEDVPHNLLGTSTTTTEPPAVDEGRFDLTLYFLAEDDSLWTVSRPRERRPGLQEVLDSLVAGPLESETAILPIRARLSDSLSPVAAQPINGFLSITVADEGQFRENPNRLATQVLVCTLTQFSTVNSIELRDTSGPIPLSDIDSVTILEPVRRSDYNDCAAEDLQLFAETGQRADSGEADDLEPGEEGLDEGVEEDEDG